MPEPTRKYDLLELLGGRAHAGVTLPERHHLEAISAQLCGQLGRIPAINCHLRYSELLIQLVHALADAVVVDDLARRGLHESAADPVAIRHSIATLSLARSLLGN